jgi:hypothetical protein
MVYHQLSSYFCIKTKSKEKPCHFFIPADTFYCQRYSLYVYVYFSGLVGMIVTWRYHYRYIPFFSSSFSLFLRCLFSFFSRSSSTLLLWDDDVCWTYRDAYICTSVCSLCATVCHLGIHVIYSSEEITLLYAQSNTFSSLPLIIR